MELVEGVDFVAYAMAIQFPGTSRWPDLRRILLLRVQLSRIEAVFLKARVILALIEHERGAHMALIAQVDALAGTDPRGRHRVFNVGGKKSGTAGEGRLS